jgi:hypothetical protein
MTDDPMVLMTVTGDGGPPSLGNAARQLKVSVEALDKSFGVALVDPTKGLYAVRLPASQLPANHTPGPQGPFSDPPIEPFGPVQSSSTKD